MKKLLVLALLGWVGFLGIRQLESEAQPVGPPEPLYDHPYVVVYGRDSCGNTQYMRMQLERERVRFDYQVVDVEAVRDLLHQRMEQSGISTGRYTLPVVDVSGTLMVSPPPEQVAEAYRQSLRDSLAAARTGASS